MIARAVVTGANGFIGRALVRYLAEGGTSVVAIDRSPTVTSARVTSRVADIASPGAYEGCLTPDTMIFHLASSADVVGSVRDPAADLRDNFLPLFHTLEAARAAGAGVIFPSTASVYDPANALPLNETALPRPTSPYAAGKLAGEAYCFAYHRSYGLDVRVARLFSVYGVGMTRFAIHDIVRRIQAGCTELTILGDGSQIRDYLFVDDAVRGLVLMAEAGRAGEDYNIASGIPVRLYDLASQIIELMGCPTLPIAPTGQSFAGDTARWYADVSKMRALGFVPEVNLSEGLLRTIQWLGATPSTGKARSA